MPCDADTTSLTDNLCYLWPTSCSTTRQRDVNVTSMDKRKGSYLGAPKHKKHVAVVLAKNLENDDVILEQVFSNYNKALSYVESHLASDGARVHRWAERWLVR